MSENNESGNRWEKPAEDDQETPEAVEPAETTEAEPQTVAPPVLSEQRTITLPAWMTKRGLIATGAAAAIFVGGGGVGYAVGVHHHGEDRSFPARFDRAGFNGQLPDSGQFPGGPMGQAPQSQGQSSNGSGSSS